MNRNELQVVDNSNNAAEFFLQEDGGTIRVADSVSSFYDIMTLGQTSGTHLVLRRNQVEARNASIDSTLFLNFSGGEVNVNAGGLGGVSDGFRIPFSDPVSLGSTNHGFQIGQTSGLNIAMDTNEIQGRNNGATSPINLQPHTGRVSIGSNDSGFNSELFIGVSSSSYTILTRNQLRAEFAGGVSTLFLNNLGGLVNIGGPLLVRGNNIDCDTPPTTAGAATAEWNLISGTQYRLRRSTSSLRYKENVRPAEIDVDAVLSLEPKTFQRNDETDADDNPIPAEETPWRVGFIAEEAEEAGLDAWIVRDGEGRVDGFTYHQFTVAHQAVLRQQQERIAQLEADNARLEERLSALEERLR